MSDSKSLNKWSREELENYLVGKEGSDEQRRDALDELTDRAWKAGNDEANDHTYDG